MEDVASASAQCGEGKTQREIEQQPPEDRAGPRIGRVREFRGKEIDARGERSAEVETDAAGVNGILGHCSVNVIQLVAQGDAEPCEIVRRKRARLEKVTRLLQ